MVQIVTAMFVGLISVYCIATAVVGYFLHPLNIIGRLIMAATGLLLLYQSQITNIAGLVLLTTMAVLIRRKTTAKT